MSRSDFEDRPWLGIKGWPYTFDELLPFYEKAQTMLDLGPYSYHPTEWSDKNYPFLSFDPTVLETRIWQLCRRTNLGQRYQVLFDRSHNIEVILNATATEIITDERRRQVIGVKAQSLKGHTAFVRARAYVLACGGVDNARMLLLSRNDTSKELGNDHDVVGRYFMQHPHIGAASLHFRDARHWLKSYKYRSHGHIWTRAWVGMSRQAQQQHHILNPVASFINRFIADSLTHGQSIGYVATKRLLLEASRGRAPKHLLQELTKIAGDVPGIVTGCWQHLRHKTGALYVMAEQVPNENSRITLSTRRDVFGLERARIDWRLSPIDKRSIRVMVAMIDEELQRLGRGQAIPDEWLTADDSTWPDRVTGGFHHMGTTRMGTNPKDSVVDADARVHSVDNLFVAGSSIFPTVGCANPTLTIVATSLKLSEHLAKMLKTKTLGAIVASERNTEQAMLGAMAASEGLSITANQEKAIHC